MDHFYLACGLLLAAVALRVGVFEYLSWKIEKELFLPKPTKKNSLVLWRWDEIKRKRK